MKEPYRFIFTVILLSFWTIFALETEMNDTLSITILLGIFFIWFWVESKYPKQKDEVKE